MDIPWARLRLALRNDVWRNVQLASASGNHDRWERVISSAPRLGPAPAALALMMAAKHGRDTAQKIHGSTPPGDTYESSRARDRFDLMHNVLASVPYTGAGASFLHRTAFTAGYLSGLNPETLLYAMYHANFESDLERSAAGGLYTNAAFPPVVRTIAARLLVATAPADGTQAAAQALGSALWVPADDRTELGVGRANYLEAANVFWACATPGASRAKVTESRTAFPALEAGMWDRSPPVGRTALCTTLPREAGELSVVEIEDPNSAEVTAQLAMLAREQTSRSVYSYSAAPDTLHVLATNWPGLAVKAAELSGTSGPRVDHVVHFRPTFELVGLGEHTRRGRLTEIPIGPEFTLPLEGLKLDRVLQIARDTTGNTNRAGRRTPRLATLRQPREAGRRGR